MPIDVDETVTSRWVRFFSANRALQAANIELQHLATTDRLTGVWNRPYCEEAVAAQVGFPPTGLRDIAKPHRPLFLFSSCLGRALRAMADGNRFDLDDKP